MGRGGEDLTQAAMPPLHSTDLLRTDQRYAPFLSDSFDPSQFASNALANTQTTAQAQIDHLQQGIAILDSQLRQLVLRHREDLIKHASKSDEIDVSIQRISLSVRSLQSVAARVRAEVMEPYQDIATKTRQLKHIQTTVHLLRHTIHRVKLVQRLRSEISSGNTTDVLELAKAARLLSDIAAVDAEIDLTGIDIIDQDRDFIESTNASVRTHIDAALRSGLDSLSQADVGSALQALYNLQELDAAVYSYLNSSIASIEKAFTNALDARKLSSAASSSTSTTTTSSTSLGLRGASGAFQGSSTSSRLQDVLWERLGEACDSLWRAAMSAWHLQRVLLKKKDPMTHQLFIDTVVGGGRGGEGMPLDYFWDKTIDALSRSFSTATRAGFIRDSLIHRYPSLATMLDATCTRILKDGTTRDAPPAIPHRTFAASLRAVAADAEEGYISAVTARLQAAAKAAFPGGARATPSAADLQSFVAHIHEELKFVEGSGQRLVTRVAATVGNALMMAAERASVMAAGSGGADAMGVINVDSGCTPAQYRGITLCNALQEMHRSVAALLPRLQYPNAARSLIAPLETLHATALDVMAPLFRGMVDVVQDRILELHSLNLAADDGAEGLVTETSRCIKDVCRILAMYRSEYLAKFNPPPAVGSSIESAQRAMAERMARRILTFFVRQASLVRPLSHPGKLQLAKDGAELEAAVVQHIVPAEYVGAPLRTLRALRTLLFIEDDALNSKVPAMVAHDIQRSTVLHHLFSRLPSVIESPHTKNGLTPAQYSLWLDNHSEDETIAFIGTALKNGVAKAKSVMSGVSGNIVKVMEMVVAMKP